MIEIPIIDAPHQTLMAPLGGQRFRLTVWWQPSDAHWYINVDLVSGKAMAHGRRLTEGGTIIHSLAFGGRMYLDGSGEPGRTCWADGTHRLLFEPD